MNYVSNVTRSVGDPKIVQSGSSSFGGADGLGRALGWFSLGLGLTQLMMPRRITEALGMEGDEGLVQAYGVREIGSGVVSLSVDKDKGLWSRVAGDGLDLVTLATVALRPGNPKRGNATLALLAVVGITAIDVCSALAVTKRHSRAGGSGRLYRDRSGFPQGLEGARGAGREFAIPRDVRTGQREPERI